MPDDPRLEKVKTLVDESALFGVSLTGKISELFIKTFDLLSAEVPKTRVFRGVSWDETGDDAAIANKLDEIATFLRNNVQEGESE